MELKTIDSFDANKKIKLGQFFTKQGIWLKEQIYNFIISSACETAYDPFAGGGDLLNAVKSIPTIKNVYGLDIDNTLNWSYNDSLINIPQIDNAIIITNPPYIAKQSASRKKINLDEYFKNTLYDDVYLIALDKMLDAQKYVVAIIPESFINSNFIQKNKLNSITILEENPFTDTENPVCVVCFDGVIKEYSQIKIYKNDNFVSNLEKILSVRLEPSNLIKISFNNLNGWLGLRAIDSTKDDVKINFDFKENFDYDWENNIKISSRHFTLIDVDVPKNRRKGFVDKCNSILLELRQNSQDIILTPFKGNTKGGYRRRRLDFKLARAIMERAVLEINGGQIYEKYRLF